jgi:hypothetical protein
MENSEVVVKIFASREVGERLRDAINAFLVNDNAEGATPRALARNTILEALDDIDGLVLEEVEEDGETE